MSSCSIGNDGSCCGSVSFLKWKDCDTLSKKIGFIAGNGINFVARNVGNALSLAQRSYRYYTPRGNNQGLSNSQAGQFRKIMNAFFRKMGQVNFQIRRVISGLFHSAIVRNSLGTVNQWIIKPICNHILSPLRRKIGNLFKSLITNVFKGLKKMNNLTFIPFNQQVLSPILNKIGSVIKYFTLNISKPVLKPVWKWVVVPFGTNVVKPVFSSIGDFFYALVSGTARGNESKMKIIDLDEDLSNEQIN